MKKLTLLLLLALAASAQAQNKLWSRNYADPVSSGNDESHAIATDDKGNSYVTGYTTGPTNNKDIVTVKYSASGTQLFSVRYNGSDNKDDEAAGIAVDKNKNIYITGYSISTTTGKDIITIKYDSAGVKLWEAKYKGSSASGNDYSVGIKLDALGNAYVAGTCIDNAGGANYVVIKYRSNGTVRWSKTYDLAGDASVNMTLDDSCYVYVCGESNPGNNLNAVTLKFDSAGNLKWMRQYDGPDQLTDGLNDIAVTKRGEVYVCGYSEDSITTEDYLLVKYTAQGVNCWSATYSPPGANGDFAITIAVDSLSNAYVSGMAFFGFTYDVVTMKYDSGGAEKWKQIYSPNGNAGYSDVANDIVLNKNLEIYVTGKSGTSSTDFNCFLIKYDNAGNQPWVVTYNGTGSKNDESNAIVLDINENPILAGLGTNTSLNSDMLTLKYDPFGTLQWVKYFDDVNFATQELHNILTDKLGNTYVSGYAGSACVLVKYDAAGNQVWDRKYNPSGKTSKCIAFDIDKSDNNSIYLAIDVSTVPAEVHVVKYDSSGNKLWDTKCVLTGYTGYTDNFSRDIKVDAKGNVLVGINPDGTGYNDPGVAKYDKIGNQKWVKLYPKTNGQTLFQVCTDASCNVYMLSSLIASNKDFDLIKYDSSGTQKWVFPIPTGFTSGSTTVKAEMVPDANSNIYTVSTFVNHVPKVYTRHTLTLKINTGAGTLVWSDTLLDGNRLLSPFFIDLDAASNIYIYSDALDTTGNGKMGLIKYNSQGALQWTTYFKTSTYIPVIADICTDSAGMTYMVGTINQFVYDGILLKYDPYGKQQWFSTFNGLGSEKDWFYHVALDPSGNVLVSGNEAIVTNDRHSLVVKYGNSNTTIGIGELLKPKPGTNSFALYPNPNTGEFTIELPGEFKPGHVLLIYDLFGKEISSSSILSKKTELDLSALAKGMYFCRLVSSDGSIIGTEKVIVQ